VVQVEVVEMLLGILAIITHHQAAQVVQVVQQVLMEQLMVQQVLPLQVIQVKFHNRSKKWQH
jgi:hypothetical protein